MANELPQHITIIGVGLLGGSIGLALRKLSPQTVIAGVGRRESSLAEARGIGAIDVATTDATDVVGDSDLVVLCTPVGAFSRHLAQIEPHLKPGCVVTDVGSTKAEVVTAANNILGPQRFLGSHPMAGMEKKGPQYATADLYRDALCILTPVEASPRDLVNRIDGFWRQLGMRTLELDPQAHDQAVAAVSHVPHLLSSLLMNLPAPGALPLAATGLRDMTRLAAGDPEMWRDITLTNREAILQALTRLQENLRVLGDIVQRGDARGIEQLLAKAKRRRDEHWPDQG
jgi:prephenate dehydrogenase